MINQSLIASSHCHLLISSSSRPPSRSCVSLSSRSLPVIYRLVSRLVPSSCYCVSSSSRLRLSSVQSSYSSPIISIVHLSARIAPSLPFPVVLILPHIAVLRSSLPAAVLSISSSSFHPRTDGEIELMKTARPSYRQTARPSRHRHAPAQ